MKNKGLFSSLALGTILSAGFLAVWVVMGVIALENGRMIALRRHFEEDALSIRADGTALIAHTQDGVGSYRDLAGSTVSIPEEDRVGWFSGASLAESMPWKKEHADWDARSRVFSDGRPRDTSWYFITDGRPDGKAYFVGYDSHNQTRIGYLGRSGFRVEPPPAEEQFPFAGATTGLVKNVICPAQDGRPPTVTVRRGNGYEVRPLVALPAVVYILGLDHTLYFADLRNRTVRVLFQEPGLRSMALIEDRNDHSHTSWRLAARTDAAVLVLDKHGEPVTRYPIPEELRQKPFTFGETTAGEALLQWNKERDMMDEEEVSRLFWVRPDGRTRTAEVTLPHSPFRELRYLVAALLPSPVVLDIVGVVYAHGLHEDGRCPSFGSALARTLTLFWPAALLAQLLSAGLAVLCYRRQVRYGTSRTERIIWPLFVLLLGLPGWIGYRFGRTWSVLETCPECGRAVPRDREACVRCENEFPTAALKGTEVFA